ncbi:hypothetical protein BN130_3614 [Cronobacter malonaticus 507]|nr:hypothetical protein BN130_3614 [Cronobacter malonaticus 507]
MIVSAFFSVIAVLCGATKDRRQRNVLPAKYRGGRKNNIFPPP